MAPSFQGADLHILNIFILCSNINYNATTKDDVHKQHNPPVYILSSTNMA